MKIRSRKLYEYLLQAGVLNGPEEAIIRAKKTYRKEYKSCWKKKKRLVKEIRFTLTLKEFAALRQQSQIARLRHTTYAKSVVLDAIGKPSLQNDALLEVLQSVGMAIIAFETGKSYQYTISLLLHAETRLKQYLKVA